MISDYLRACSDQSSGRVDLKVHRGRSNGSMPVMTSLSLWSEGKRDVESVRMGADLEVEVEFDLKETTLSPVLGVVVKSSHGHALFGVNNKFIPGYHFDRMSSSGTIICRIEGLPLMPGPYYLDLYLGDEHRDIDIIPEAVSFDVLVSDVFGSGKMPPEVAGPIFLPATFSLARS